MTRRGALTLLILAAAWSDSVIASRPPKLQMAFGGEDGFSAIDLRINDQWITITPEQLLEALKG